MKKKLIKSFIFLFMLISFIYFLSLNGFIKISSNYAIENNENKINCNDDYAYILIKV